MNINIKEFFKDTVIGGLVVILPIGLIVAVFAWGFSLISAVIEPISNYLTNLVGVNGIGADLLSIILIVISFFIIGLLTRTAFGKMMYKYSEGHMKNVIPFYKMVKEVVHHLFSEGITFESVVVVTPFGGNTKQLGFLTGTSNGYCSVYIPTSPNPSNGTHYIIPEDKVDKVDIEVSEAMRIIMSLGQGSADMIK